MWWSISLFENVHAVPTSNFIVNINCLRKAYFGCVIQADMQSQNRINTQFTKTQSTNKEK